MRNFFEPSAAPPWLRQVLSSIRAALGDIWPAALRLKDYATAARPDATLFGAGLIYDSTVSRPAYSDGAAWFELMPYNAGAALTKTDDTNVTLALGGSPGTALLAAASLTLGWTGTLAVGRGGTGLSSFAVGDLIYASGATALSKLADVATGNVLISGGVTTAPSWGKVGLTTHVSGTLAVANGGTGVTSSTGTTNVVLSATPTLTGNPKLQPATNKRMMAVEVTASSVTGYTTGGAALTFSRPSDGVDSLAAVYLFHDGSAQNNLVVASRHKVIIAAGGSGLFDGAPEIVTFDTTGPNLASGKTLRVNATQVLTSRRTGWTADTGTR